MVLICISPMISDVEQLFVCLFAICVSSLEKCLFRSLSIFKLDRFYFKWVFIVVCFLSTLAFADFCASEYFA